jgi:hypothetical protein
MLAVVQVVPAETVNIRGVEDADALVQSGPNDRDGVDVRPSIVNRSRPSPSGTLSSLKSDPESVIYVFDWDFDGAASEPNTPSTRSRAQQPRKCRSVFRR